MMHTVQGPADLQSARTYVRVEYLVCCFTLVFPTSRQQRTQNALLGIVRGEGRLPNGEHRAGVLVSFRLVLILAVAQEMCCGAVWTWPLLNRKQTQPAVDCSDCVSCHERGGRDAMWSLLQREGRRRTRESHSSSLKCELRSSFFTV